MFDRLMYQALNSINRGVRDRVPNYSEVAKPKWDLN